MSAILESAARLDKQRASDLDRSDALNGNRGAAMSDKTREAPSDERILHLWDIYVGYESASRSAMKMPLSYKDKLAFARAALAELAAANAQEVKRLREALMQILEIEDQRYGGDWEEISRARDIARAALQGDK